MGSEAILKGLGLISNLTSPGFQKASLVLGGQRSDILGGRPGIKRPGFPGHNLICRYRGGERLGYGRLMGNGGGGSFHTSTLLFLWSLGRSRPNFLDIHSFIYSN